MSDKEDIKNEYSDEEEEEENEKKEVENEPRKKERKTSGLIFSLKEFVELSEKKEFEAAVDGYIKAIGDSVTNFLFAFEHIVKEIVKAEGAKRAAILVSLTKLLKEFKGEKDVDNLYTSILRKCERTNKPELKAKRNSAIVLCMTAISHADLIKEKKDTVYKIIKAIFTVCFQNPSIRLLGLTAIYDLLERNDISAEEYKQNVYPRLHGKFVGSEPTSIDQLFIEIKLGQKYPDSQCLVDISSITSLESLKKYTPLLEHTADTNGNHPIWKLLCEINYKQIYAAATELWAVDEKDTIKRIAVDAIAAVLNKATKEEFLEISRNQTLLDAAAKVRKNDVFTVAFSSALQKYKDIIADVVVSLLLNANRKNPFVVKTIFDTLIKIDDKETKEIIKKIDSMEFESINQILQAQPKRESLADEKIISTLFDVAIKKATKNSQKQILSKFATMLILYNTKSGKSYYTIFTGKNLKISEEEPKDVKEVLKRANAVYQAIDEVNKKIGFTLPIEIKECKTLDELLDFFKKIKETKLTHLAHVTANQLEPALPFLKGEECEIIKSFPFVIPKAIQIKGTCPAALKFIISDFKELPEKCRSFLQSFNFETAQIDADEAADVIKTALEINNISEVGRKCIEFAIKNASDEKKAELVTSKIESLAKNSEKKIAIKETMKDLINSSQAAAKALLEVVSKNVDEIKKPNSGVLQAVRGWLIGIIDKVDDNELIDVVIKLVLNEYQSTASGNKKLEENVRWLVLMLDKIATKPTAKTLEPITELVEKSKSTHIKKAVARLASKEEGKTENK